MTLEEPQPPAVATPPRRRLRFSLRTLLIATPILAVLFAWIGAEKMRHDKDQAAAERIRSRFDTTWSSENGRWNVLPTRYLELFRGRLYLPKTRLLVRGKSFLQPAEFDAEDWEAMENLTAIEDLKLFNFRERGAGATFSRLHALKSLELGDCALTRNDLRQISGLDQLTRLYTADFDGALYRIRGLDVDPRDWDKPPPDVVFDLSQFDIAPGSWPRMETLRLTSYQLPDESFQAISEMKSLQKLTIATCDFDTRSLDKLENLPNLTEIELWPNSSRRRIAGRKISGDNVDERTLTHWGRLQRLEYLHLCDVRLKTFGGGEEDLSQRWPSLNKLSFFMSTLSPQAIREIAAMPQLSSLSIDDCSVEISSLDELRSAEQLSQLTQAREVPTQSPIKDIPYFLELKSLTASGEEIDDQMMVEIAAIKGLNALTLRNTKVSDHGIAVLENHPTLRNLSVENAPITNRSLASIARIPTLTFKNCSLQGTGVDQFLLHSFNYVGVRREDILATLEAKRIFPAEPPQP